MPDWGSSMEQTFEYYTVDPYTWGDDRLITTVTNCTITRDLSNETLGSATLDADEDLNDKYVRVYLVTLQKRIREKFPLATFLCQSNNLSYDGMRKYRSYDCYTPLIELKEKPMPLGYTIQKGQNLLTWACNITEENVRAPVTKTSNDDQSMILEKDFVSEESDTKLSFLSDLLGIGKYSFGLDERGQIFFSPYQEIEAIQPRIEFNDGNSSILYPEIGVSSEVFDIPNVVEVVYSPASGSAPLVARRVNDDPDSPVSTIARGREIIYRITNPKVGDNIDQGTLNMYADIILKEKSTAKYTLTYSHGFFPVRLNDCVRLNYERAGVVDVNAKITRQVIHCSPGCKVEETSVFTRKLWGK